MSTVKEIPVTYVDIPCMEYIPSNDTVWCASVEGETVVIMIYDAIKFTMERKINTTHKSVNGICAVNGQIWTAGDIILVWNEVILIL